MEAANQLAKSSGLYIYIYIEAVCRPCTKLSNQEANKCRQKNLSLTKLELEQLQQGFYLGD